MSREAANFRTYWKGTAFSSILEPIVYLLAFGVGLGSTLIDGVDGLSYAEFVATGMVATAVIFSSALPAMFGTFVKERFQNTYDAILAAPVDVEELVTAEMLWIGLRVRLLRLLPAAGRNRVRARPDLGDAARPDLRLRHRPRLRRLRHLGRGERLQDRPVQLRDDAGDHAALPGRRAPSSRSTSSPRGCRSPPTSTRSTSSSSWSAGAAFGFEAVDMLRFVGLVRLLVRPLARSPCRG